jgi:uncharacterized protein YbjT (DUF2867 family)
MIAIMGATGNTGRVAAERLLAAGHPVRALGRSAERLSGLAAMGADVAVGDAGDAEYLAAAFDGAEAVYAMIPPDYQNPDYVARQDEVGEAITSAVLAAGKPRVVFLSSLGAEHAEGTGPIAGMHRQEERFRGIDGLDAVFLRPGSFFENHYNVLGLIKHQGINGGAFAPDVAHPQIATRDIGVAAADALVSDFSGVEVRELLGPRDLSQAEVTTIIGEQIGLPDLQYVQFPYDDYAAALVQTGLSASTAGLLAEMSEAMNEGRIGSVAGRQDHNTTPTEFETFAEGLAEAYRGM